MQSKTPFGITATGDVLTSPIRIRQDRQPRFNGRLHCHPEMELIYFRKGSGKQFIGDKGGHFKKGDLLLIGQNLAHYWEYPKALLSRRDGIESLVVHFSPGFLSQYFLQAPEAQPVNRLLNEASYGLEIKGAVKKRIVGFMEQLLSARGFMRYVLLLAILDNMANRAKLTGLASRHDSVKMLSGVSSDRVSQIREYVYKRFRQRISLEEIAGVAHLSPHSFCRFFKNSTGKTFARFVLEVRISHACTLLAGGKKSLKAISRESGFNNMTCFYKYFKAITGMTPGEYNRLSAPAPLHDSHFPAPATNVLPVT